MLDSLKHLIAEPEAKKQERLTSYFICDLKRLEYTPEYRTRVFGDIRGVASLLESAFKLLNGPKGIYISQDAVLKEKGWFHLNREKKHHLKYNVLMKLVVQYGRLEHVQLMLQRFPKLRTRGGMNGQLMFAAREGKLDIVRYLLAEIHVLLSSEKTRQGVSYIEHAEYMENLGWHSMATVVKCGEYFVALYIEDYFRKRFNTVLRYLELSDGYKLYRFLASRFVSQFSLGFMDSVEMVLHVLSNKDKVAPLFCVSQAWKESLDAIIPSCADASRIVLSFVMFGNDFSFSSIHALKFAALPCFIKNVVPKKSKRDFDYILWPQCKSVLTEIINNPHSIATSTEEGCMEKYYAKFPKDMVHSCLEQMKAEGKKVSKELSSTILAKLSDDKRHEQFDLDSKQWLYIFEFIANPDSLERNMGYV